MYYYTCDLPDSVSKGVVDSFLIVPGVIAENIVEWYEINVRYHSTCDLPDSVPKGVIDSYVLVPGVTAKNIVK